MNMPDVHLSLITATDIQLTVTMILQPEYLKIEWPYNVEISYFLMDLFA